MTHRLQQSYPDLQPLYDAARSYLEIPQRINLLNTRVEVRPFLGSQCVKALTLFCYARFYKTCFNCLKNL